MKVERKRHLGNDVVMIIFREGENEPFSPKWVRSQFNHVFIVVTPVAHPKGKPGTWYKLAISCKEGVIPFQPRLPFPPYLRKGKKAREWFLSKRTRLFFLRRFCVRQLNILVSWRRVAQ
jgi:hypothetical protein